MRGNILIGLIIGIVIGIAVSWIGLKMTRSSAIPVPSTTQPVTQKGISQKQVDLQLVMRKLWEDHITWTRMWIVSFANSNDDSDAVASRLLKNQEDIGNAIKPYYGEDAGNKLTVLLKDHINLAVELVKAAKTNDTNALNTANDKWYKNANDIADFLSSANPNWPNADLRIMMKDHLDLTKTEAVDTLGKKYDVSVSDYDKVHDEILKMADVLSNGIIKQFPDKFK